ncbi:MAG: hypothetical protein FWC64_09770 [Treponema sp.]|nr:hypothetical protein [Treponema sp.]
MRKLLLALAIVFLFASCDTDIMDIEINPFIGTWEDELGFGIGLKVKH